MGKKNLKGWLYLAPALAFIGVFMVYPLIDVFIYSFEEGYNSASQTSFGIGFYNYAYVLRDNSIMRFTDDREPQGTAGMPVLDAIRKNGCTDTVIVVTRYFGGTLLGTGGLVRAYSAAAIGALKSAEIIEYDVYSELTLEVDYSDYQKILPILTKRGFRTENSRFTASVELYGTVKKSELELLADELTQATCGRIKTKIIGEKFAF